MSYYDPKVCDDGLMAALDTIRQDLARIDSAPKKPTSVDGRELAYDFYGLSFSGRYHVMEGLGFARIRNEKVSANEEIGRFFDWVRENKLIDRLRDAIIKERDHQRSHSAKP